MSPEQIVSIEHIQRKARDAFNRGKPASYCAMNPSSAAYQTWHEEYARLQAEAAWVKATDRELA